MVICLHLQVELHPQVWTTYLGWLKHLPEGLATGMVLWLYHIGNGDRICIEDMNQLIRLIRQFEFINLWIGIDYGFLVDTNGVVLEYTRTSTNIFGIYIPLDR